MNSFLSRSPNLMLPMILFLLAFFISIHATGVLQRVARFLGVMDRPGGRKRQASPVPYLGGVAIYAGVLAALVIGVWASGSMRWSDLGAVPTILLASGFVFLVGLADDIWGVHSLLKLAVLAAACVFLLSRGIGVTRTPWLLVNYGLTFLWVAGISSAFNAIDNTDGLAGSIALISCGVLFLLGWATWQTEFSWLTMALAGGILGFLHHNINPAKIYMGDSGSFLLGFLLSVLVMFGEWSDNAWQSLLAGALVVAFPAYDLGLTSVLRIRHGIVRSLVGLIAHSDTDHLSHRLQKMGYSQRRMLLVLGGLHVIVCLAAMLVARRPMWVVWSVFALMGLILLAFGIHVDRASSRAGLWSAASRPGE